MPPRTNLGGAPRADELPQSESQRLKEAFRKPQDDPINQTAMAVVDPSGESIGKMIAEALEANNVILRKIEAHLGFLSGEEVGDEDVSD